MVEQPKVPPAALKDWNNKNNNKNANSSKLRRRLLLRRGRAAAVLPRRAAAVLLRHGRAPDRISARSSSAPIRVTMAFVAVTNGV
jgi:hypothetical protein